MYRYAWWTAKCCSVAKTNSFLALSFFLISSQENEQCVVFVEAKNTSRKSVKRLVYCRAEILIRAKALCQRETC